MPEIPASAGRSPLRDLHVPRPVKKSKTVYEGRVWDIARESFRLDPADKSQDPLTRELMVHPGAVAILAVRTKLTTTGPRVAPAAPWPAARKAAARRDTPNEKPVAGRLWPVKRATRSS